MQPRVRVPESSLAMLGRLGWFHEPTGDSAEGTRVSLETEQDGDVDPDPGFERVGWQSEEGSRKK